MKTISPKRRSWETIKFCALIVVSMVVASGCSKKTNEPPPPDFRVHVQDAQGLGVGSPAQWRGVEVGRVHSVVMDKGLIRIDVQLNEAYIGKFHDGLRARPTRGFMGRGATVLELFGGGDSQKPVLALGAQIPEATLTDTTTPRQLKVGGLLVLAIIIFLVVLGLMRKLAAIALVLVLLVFSGWFLHRQWQRYGEDVMTARMEMQWSDMAHSMLTEESAQEAWATAQTDLAEAIKDLGGMGKEHLNKEKAKIRDDLVAKAKKLSEQGKEAAASELKKFVDEAFSKNKETQKE